MPVARVSEVKAAVEKHLDVRVHDVRRQTRWRPTWFVDAERNGAPVLVVVRGERVDTSVWRE